MSRKDEIMQLIIRHQRRLQKLKEQQATMGLQTPPHILTEIEDIEAEIEGLQKELTILDQPQKPLTLYYKYQSKPREIFSAQRHEIIIGRPKDIPIDLDLSPDLKVSRPHARLSYRLSTWWVEDLHSRHNTFLNGEIIGEEKELLSGDELKLGDTVLRVEFDSPETVSSFGNFENQTTIDEVRPAAGISEDKRIELLARITTLVASASDSQILLDQFIGIIDEVFPQIEHRSILLIEDNNELVIRAPRSDKPVQVSFTLVRQAIRSQQTLHWIGSLSSQDDRPESLYDTTTALCTPMLFSGRAIGAIYVSTTQTDVIFDKKTCDFLSEMATMMARSLQIFQGQIYSGFPSVFISYTSGDRKFVNRLAADLRRRRIKVWFDERLRIGDKRQKVITRAIETTDNFVLIMSPESVTSRQVLNELATAFAKQKRVLPLMCQPCQPPAQINNQIHHLDLGPAHYQAGLEQLVEVINAIPELEFDDSSQEPGRSSISQGELTAEIEKVSPNYILFLAANPRDTDWLRLAEESRTIEACLNQTKFREKFAVVQHWAARHTDLSEQLLRYQPRIVHFSGHGSASGEIILENVTGLSQPVTTGALRQLFRILKDNIRCVVLNACFSDIQAKAIAEEIDCVIGMSVGISDQAAIRFAAGFYRALGYGRSVQTAFELGCNEIDLANLDQSLVPQLLEKSKGKASITNFI